MIDKRPRDERYHAVDEYKDMRNTKVLITNHPHLFSLCRLSEQTVWAVIVAKRPDVVTLVRWVIWFFPQVRWRVLIAGRQALTAVEVVSVYPGEAACFEWFAFGMLQTQFLFRLYKHNRTVQCLHLCYGGPIQIPFHQQGLATSPGGKDTHWSKWEVVLINQYMGGLLPVDQYLHPWQRNPFLAKRSEGSRKPEATFHDVQRTYSDCFFLLARGPAS